MLELELIQPSAELMALISQDSRLYAMSIYDASYVTLAGVLSANFVTADDALFEKCRKTGRVLRLQGLDQDWMT
jgi:predicted nucleic acid-binding protein